MKKLLLVGMLAIGFTSCHAQSQKQETYKLVTYKNPVADETVIKPSGEKNFKVISSNMPIVTKLLRVYPNQWKSISKKYKSDRYGYYPEHTVVFPNEYFESVYSFLKAH